MWSRALGRLGVWLIASLMFAAMAAWGEVASISPDDWQYRELDALAQAGLLQGHPKGPIGDWAGERLTRFEAASLALRAVEGVGAAYREQGEALVQVAQAEAAAEQPMPAGVSAVDLARVEKLIEEFRAELVTMGARVHEDLGFGSGDNGHDRTPCQHHDETHSPDLLPRDQHDVSSSPLG